MLATGLAGHDIATTKNKNKSLNYAGSTSSQVQSICDAHDIPHIQTRWDLFQSNNKFSINLMPSPVMLSQVSRVLLRAELQITTLIYSSGLQKLSRKLRLEIFYFALSR